MITCAISMQSASTLEFVSAMLPSNQGTPYSFLLHHRPSGYRQARPEKHCSRRCDLGCDKTATCFLHRLTTPFHGAARTRRVRIDARISYHLFQCSKCQGNRLPIFLVHVQFAKVR
jgi:hypothetical protein